MAEPTKSADIAVHTPQSDEERNRIYAFRYRWQIMKKGADSVFADHKKMIVRDPLDDAALQLCLVKLHAVAASVRINSCETTELPKEHTDHFLLDRFSKFKPEDLTFTSRLVVSDEGNPAQLAAVLLGAAYKVARNMGSRFDFTSCAPSLVALYECLGYRRYAPNFVDQDESYQVPMALLTEDVAHLREVKSPFARLAADYTNTVETSQWFEREFPESVKAVAERSMDEEKFWRELTNKMQQAPTDGIPLLDGVSYTEAKRVLHAGSSLRCGPGGPIVTAGDTSREMDVILSGSVEVRAGGRVLARLERGEIFGEGALISAAPRTADVYAVDDVEVLILTQDFLRRGMKSMPEIMAKILFNLSMTLVGRLRDSTMQLSGGDGTGEPAIEEKQRRSA